ncbi:transmembrane protein, putative (macronuclear) [Tetrahymena thermophila SB210]|uniref:Transmembrane protein, putative n=1 Tax=Tetrahymena thermophila (strain SB210) TaxID=312017 RepID=I7MAR0_TETTS|nr:transmembrane protein, putative [Tetrahymena thermophila SB210]EAS05130.2 transmembrane protein, putative [Tetrahymena thermophila SB210]|eukprot:XP_001025375.2 transmembrane protein, putative [Tetrahymena thermophila SB210]
MKLIDSFIIENTNLLVMAFNGFLSLDQEFQSTIFFYEIQQNKLMGTIKNQNNVKGVQYNTLNSQIIVSTTKFLLFYDIPQLQLKQKVQTNLGSQILINQGIIYLINSYQMKLINQLDDNKIQIVNFLRMGFTEQNYQNIYHYFSEQPQQIALLGLPNGQQIIQFNVQNIVFVSDLTGTSFVQLVGNDLSIIKNNGQYIADTFFIPGSYCFASVISQSANLDIWNLQDYATQQQHYVRTIALSNQQGIIIDQIFYFKQGQISYIIYTLKRNFNETSASSYYLGQVWASQLQLDQNLFITGYTNSNLLVNANQNYLIKIDIFYQQNILFVYDDFANNKIRLFSLDNLVTQLQQIPQSFQVEQFDMRTQASWVGQNQKIVSLQQKNLLIQQNNDPSQPLAYQMAYYLNLYDISFKIQSQFLLTDHYFSLGDLIKVQGANSQYLLRAQNNQGKKLRIFDPTQNVIIGEWEVSNNSQTVLDFTKSDPNIQISAFYINGSYNVCFAIYSRYPNVYQNDITKQNYGIECVSFSTGDMNTVQYYVLNNPANSKSQLFQSVFYSQKQKEIIGFLSSGQYLRWNIITKTLIQNDFYNIQNCQNSPLLSPQYIQEEDSLLVDCSQGLTLIQVYKNSAQTILVNKPNSQLMSFQYLNINNNRILITLQDYSMLNLIDLNVVLSPTNNIQNKYYPILLYDTNKIVNILLIPSNILYIFMNDRLSKLNLTPCVNYSLDSCINSCFKQYNFQVSDQLQNLSSYGIGSSNNPFLSSNMFLFSSLEINTIINMFSQISSLNSIQVEINIQGQNQLSLRQEYFASFEKNTIVQISFQSLQQNQLSIINLANNMIIQNYQYFQIKNFDLRIQAPTDSSLFMDFQCNLIFANIQSLNLKNSFAKSVMTLQDGSVKLIPCTILFQNSKALLQDITIQNISLFNPASYQELFSFTGNQQNEIVFDTLNITSSQLDGMIIINNKSPSQLKINNLFIQDNTCQNTNTIYSLPIFLSMTFSVTKVNIYKNVFCNDVSLFNSYPINDDSIQSLIDSQNQFQNIKILENTIYYSNLKFFFLDLQLYSSGNQSNYIKIEDLMIQNNIHLQTNLLDTSKSYFQTYIFINNFSGLNIRNSYFYNQQGTNFIKTANTQNVTIQRLECINDILNQTVENGACLKFFQIQNTTIDQLVIKNQFSNGINLFSLYNQDYQDIVLSLTNSNFTNNLIQQIQQIQLSANIMYISNQQEGNILLSGLILSDNTVRAVSDLVALSTAGIYIDSFTSSVNIQNSKFLNVMTTTILSHLSINAQNLSIFQCKFQKQKYKPLSEKESQQSLVLGGMMKVNVQYLKINNSSFSDSNASLGGFIYVTSLTQVVLSISIFDCDFQNSISNDSSIIHIISLSVKEQLNIYNSNFTNIKSTNTESSRAIFLTKDSPTNLGNSMEVVLKNVKFTNITGISDVSIFYLQDCQIQAEKIVYYGREQISQEILQDDSYQDGCLFNLQNSLLNITGLEMSSLIQRTSPLLLDQDNSNKAIISNSVIQNIYFSNKGLISTNTDLELKYFQVTNSSYFQYDSGNGALISISSSSLKNYINTFIAFQLQFQNIYSTLNQAIPINAINLNTVSVLITNSSFTNLIGGAVAIQNPQKFCTIKFSNFLQIGMQQQSQQSQIITSAISLILSNDVMKNSTTLIQFEDINITQSMSYQGGGLYINSNAQNKSQSLNLTRVSFNQNYAIIGGGYFIQGMKVYENYCTFDQNSVKYYGSQGFQYPTFIQLVESDILKQYSYQYNNDKQYLHLSNITSGMTLPKLSFKVLDNKYEVVKFCIDQLFYTISDYNQLNIEIDPIFHKNKTDYYYIQGQDQVDQNCTDFTFTFDQLQYIAIPNAPAQLNVNHYIVNLNYTVFTNLTANFTIFLDVVDCNMGQIKLSTIGKYQICQACSSNTFTFDFTKCYNCPDGATCPGGSQMLIQSGYWRENQYSSIVVSCDNNYNNCIGGTAGNQLCLEGHIGPLCEECDLFGVINGNSYTRTGVYNCSPCNGQVTNIIIVIFTNLALLFQQYVVLTSDITYRKAKSRYYKSQMQKRTDTSSQMATKEEELNKNLSVYLKILMNYFQLVVIIKNFQINIPLPLINLPQTISRPVDHAVNTLDCWVKDWSTGIPYVYFRLIIACIVPAVYFALSMLLYFFYMFLKKQKPKKYILTSSIIFLFLYLQPDMIERTVSVIACRQIGNKDYLLGDLLYLCHTQDYKKYSYTIGLSLFFLFLIIVPAFLFLSLRRNKTRLKSENFLLQMGYLYSEYKESKYYWEFAKMYKKILTIMVINFYYKDITVKGFIVIFIIIIYQQISDKVKPFNVLDNNYLDQLSCKIAVLTILIGLFINNNPDPYQVVISLIVMAIFNLLFFYWIGQRIVYEYKVLIQKYYFQVKQIFKRCKRRFFSKSITNQQQQSSQNNPYDADLENQEDNPNNISKYNLNVIAGLDEAIKANPNIRYNITVSRHFPQSLQLRKFNSNMSQYYHKTETLREQVAIDLKKSKSSQSSRTQHNEDQQNWQDQSQEFQFFQKITNNNNNFQVLQPLSFIRKQTSVFQNHQEDPINEEQSQLEHDHIQIQQNDMSNYQQDSVIHQTEKTKKNDSSLSQLNLTDIQIRDDNDQNTQSDEIKINFQSKYLTKSPKVKNNDQYVGKQQKESFLDSSTIQNLDFTVKFGGADTSNFTSPKLSLGSQKNQTKEQFIFPIQLIHKDSGEVKTLKSANSCNDLENEKAQVPYQINESIFTKRQNSIFQREKKNTDNKILQNEI